MVADRKKMIFNFTNRTNMRYRYLLRIIKKQMTVFFKIKKTL